MLELWEIVYTKQYFVRVDELSNHPGSFDLTEFTVSGECEVDSTTKYLPINRISSFIFSLTVVTDDTVDDCMQAHRRYERDSFDEMV